MIALQTALKRWDRDGVRLLPTEEEAVVIASLNQTGRKVSRDVIDLYCLTGGMENGRDDAFGWSLWPLDRVVSETLSYKPPHILFADYLINSHCYCFKYQSEKTSSVHVEFFGGEEPRLVANSVAEFFELYLNDPQKLEIWDLPPVKTQ